jgi:hypothetical protein
MEQQTGHDVQKDSSGTLSDAWPVHLKGQFEYSRAKVGCCPAGWRIAVYMYSTGCNTHDCTATLPMYMIYLCQWAVVAVL